MIALHTNHKQITQLIKNYLLLTVGAVILAITFVVFLAPYEIAPGGISGITLVINRLTGWSEGLTLLVLQISMIFLGFWYLGRFQFLFKAIYVAIIYSFGVELLGSILPTNGITDDFLLNTIFGGIFGGIASGIIYFGGSSIAGTSVISRIVQLKTGLPISQIYLFVDGLIILLQAMILGWDRALYGLMMMFIYGIASDYILEGPNVISTAFIVTNQPEKISKTLLEQLHVGVTSWCGTGMFTHEEHTILFCTISRFEKNTVKQLIKDIDPNAFIVLGYGNQAIGGVVKAKKNS